MVTLPPPYVATRFSGYFWNLDTRKLYSLKITGELKVLKIRYPNRAFTRIDGPFYELSVKGRRKILTLDTLNRLYLKDSVIPEWKNDL